MYDPFQQTGRTQAQFATARQSMGKSAFVQPQTRQQMETAQQKAQYSAPLSLAWKYIQMFYPDKSYAEKREAAYRMANEYNAQQIEQMIVNTQQGKTQPQFGTSMLGRLKSTITGQPTQQGTQDTQNKVNTVMEAFQVALDLYNSGALGQAGQGGRDAAADAFMSMLQGAKPEQISEAFGSIKDQPGSSAQYFTAQGPQVQEGVRPVQTAPVSVTPVQVRPSTQPRGGAITSDMVRNYFDQFR